MVCSLQAACGLCHLYNFSQILMSIADHQSIADFQAVLDRHRTNQLLYKDRLKEINVTRGKIADQLEALQQTYDKKLRALQQKVETLRGQNDTLQRENTLFRSEIQTYQSRLLEKEKIIAALLSQRRDLPLLGSSEKSKSDKTDSLNANEEESKAFKKQPVFKQDYEHSVPVQKIKQETTLQRHPNHFEPLQKKAVEKTVEKSQVIEVKPPTFPKKKAASNVLPHQITQNETAPQVKHVEEPISIAVEQPKVIQSRPRHPPPPAKGKSKAPPKKFPISQPPQPVVQPEQQTTTDANNFFSSLGRQEIQQTHVPFEQKALQKSSHLQQQEITEPVQQQDNQNVYNAYGQEQQEQVIHTESTPEFQSEQQHYQREEQIQTQEHVERQNVEPQEVQSDFLSHFNQSQSQNNYFAPMPIKKKQKKEKPRPLTSEELIAGPIQHESTGSDFFAQLSKGQPEPQVHHHLDHIEQSSIDHIDRDNSLLSNDQPYFIEQPAKKVAKMSKKKKRDQIKMMDPSCFD